jgi:hypothetical protein
VVLISTPSLRELVIFVKSVGSLNDRFSDRSEPFPLVSRTYALGPEIAVYPKSPGVIAKRPPEGGLFHQPMMR